MVCLFHGFDDEDAGTQQSTFFEAGLLMMTGRCGGGTSSEVNDYLGLSVDVKLQAIFCMLSSLKPSSSKGSHPCWCDVIRVFYEPQRG